VTDTGRSLFARYHRIAASSCVIVRTMTTASQQTEVRLVFHYCRLGRSELDRLFSLAPEGISIADAVVSTQRDSTRYSAGNLSDLIDSLQQSSASGNLDLWDNLSQHAADAAGDRRVSIDMDGKQVVVQVSGRDATWVHGQAARLELLLEGAGGRLQDHGRKKEGDKAALISSLLALTGLLAVGAGGYIASPRTFMRQFSSSAIDYQVGGAVGVICWCVLALIGYWLVRRANRALLLPTAEAPRGSWWNRATSADRIALGGLVVATLGVVIAAVTLGGDLAGEGKQAHSDGTTAPASAHQGP